MIRRRVVLPQLDLHVGRIGQRLPARRSVNKRVVSGPGGDANTCGPSRSLGSVTVRVFSCGLPGLSGRVNSRVSSSASMMPPCTHEPGLGQAVDA